MCERSSVETSRKTGALSSRQARSVISASASSTSLTASVCSGARASHLAGSLRRCSFRESLKNPYRSSGIHGHSLICRSPKRFKQGAMGFFRGSFRAPSASGSFASSTRCADCRKISTMEQSRCARSSIGTDSDGPDRGGLDHSSTSKMRCRRSRSSAPNAAAGVRRRSRTASTVNPITASRNGPTHSRIVPPRNGGR